jgi:peroxiredoxin Q/BCP
MTLDVGNPAPDFILLDDAGRNVSLGDFSGKKLVIYFYPKDDTPGCTMEARDFSARYLDFCKCNTDVVGVSGDSADSHCNFKNKHGLSVRLLADVGNIMAKNYGVWAQKSMFGKKYMGLERATFLLNEAKVVTHVWRNVKVLGHIEAVLEAARS